MSMTFTKLFSSITESTIWAEPNHIRITWITMMAMADRKGRVWASIPGLANRARITVEEAKEALQRFLSPDEYSRTPEFEGRRIEPIEGGWRLLNYKKYRDIQDDETVLESKRKYINTRRGAEKTASEAIGKTPAKWQRPTTEQVKLAGVKMGLPEAECEKFFNYYESNGWKVGKNPMKSWPHALINWKNNITKWSSDPQPRKSSSEMTNEEILRHATS